MCGFRGDRHGRWNVEHVERRGGLGFFDVRVVRCSGGFIFRTGRVKSDEVEVTGFSGRALISIS